MTRTDLSAYLILPHVARLAKRIGSLLTTWQTRHHTRNSLSRLDDHMLRDIGLADPLRLNECRKPFWRD